MESFSPDLIHVWGTEKFWGLLTARDFIRGNVLLEMQGLKRAIAKYYEGGLTIREQLACIGVKEIIKNNVIPLQRKKYERWGEY